MTTDTTYTVEKIAEVLHRHAAWLHGAADGGRADLSGADLKWAKLSGADLSRADLSRANLRWADLSRADLSGADLSGANLSEANLSRANLSRANLSGANLSAPIVQIGPIGSRRDYLVYQAGLDEVRAGCWTGTLDAFNARVREVHGDTHYGRQYMAAIAMLRALYRTDGGTE